LVGFAAASGYWRSRNGCEDDKGYALDTATGHLVWSYPTGGIVVASPSVAGGIAYAASDDGKLYALATAK
jgi:eukaryotic-like serine/threonine-protein kinase